MTAKVTGGMQKKVFISIVISTADRARSLRTTLDSLLTMRADPQAPHEIIIVDNASIDDTRRIIEKYVPRFEGRLMYAYEPQRGLPFARNCGIRHATGDIVAFTDDDCLLPPDYIEQISRAFHTFPKAGLVGGKILPVWLTVDRPDWVDDWFFCGPLALLDYGEAPFFIDYQTDNRRFYGANFAFRRALFGQYGGFDESKTFAQDTEMCVRLLRAGVPALYFPSLQVQHQIPGHRLRPQYFYNWFYRRGKFRDDTFDDYEEKFYYPFGIPFWLMIKMMQRFWQANRTQDFSLRLQHRCWGFMHLGRMANRFRRNVT